jgi:hypothetical protein
VEDEAREHGRVKGAVYKAYLKAAGGFPYWTVVLLAFSTMQCITTGEHSSSLSNPMVSKD